MRGLRIACVFALVALLVLSSAGSVFAKGAPSDNSLGKGIKFQGEKHGFSGNVTEATTGNVTIETMQGLVTLTAPNAFQYKIPRELNKWQSGNLSDLGDLTGRRLAVLAGNVTGTWEILKLLVLPIPGTQPMHAHRTGNVTQFNVPSGSNPGNITIEDVHSVLHVFSVGNDTYYRPMGIGPGNITVGSFVTVVTTGNQKSVDLPPAKAIVLHSNMPED